MKLLKTKAYKIAEQNTGLVLGVDNASEENGAFVKLQSDAGADAKYQMWNAVYEDDTWFRLVNKQSKKALDLSMSGTMNGTWVHQWDVSDTDSQLWCLEEGEKDHAMLKSKHSTTYLDIVDGTPWDGAQVQIWEKTGDAIQNWHFEVVKTPTKPRATKKASAKKTKATKSKTVSAKTSKTTSATTVKKETATRKSVAKAPAKQTNDTKQAENAEPKKSVTIKK